MVERWDFEVNSYHMTYAPNDGEYVDYKDYKRLQDKIEEAHKRCQDIIAESNRRQGDVIFIDAALRE